MGGWGWWGWGGCVGCLSKYKVLYKPSPKASHNFNTNIYIFFKYISLKQSFAVICV